MRFTKLASMVGQFQTHFCSSIETRLFCCKFWWFTHPQQQAAMSCRLLHAISVKLHTTNINSQEKHTFKLNAIHWLKTPLCTYFESSRLLYDPKGALFALCNWTQLDKRITTRCKVRIPSIADTEMWSGTNSIQFWWDNNLNKPLSFKWLGTFKS